MEIMSLMCPAKAKYLEKVAQKLGFKKVRQKVSHARWQHSDGRVTTIPIHGNAEIGGWLFYS
jgi:predicted RNA binding protein YcfA (HicA-like mRNA interferase family)